MEKINKSKIDKIGKTRVLYETDSSLMNLKVYRINRYLFINFFKK
jgi:hypothetical protein